MAEETQVTKSFWNGVVTICAVICGALYVTDKVSSAIDAHLSPLTDRVVMLEREVKLIKAQREADMSRSKITSQTTGKLVDFINDKYKTNFYKPADFFQKPEEVKVEDEQ